MQLLVLVMLFLLLVFWALSSYCETKRIKLLEEQNRALWEYVSEYREFNYKLTQLRTEGEQYAGK